MRTTTATAFNELDRGHLIVLTAGIMVTLLLTSLDQTVVGTAMPRVISELNGLEFYAWVTTAYLVASTTFVPLAGKLGDLFGRKPFVITGVVGFVGASALCGLSQNMLQLVAFRALQGVFGGILTAQIFTVLADLYPPTQRAKMQGLFAGVFGLSSIFGPTLGGLITDTLGWRWVFEVNLPVGLVALAIIVRWMPHFTHGDATWRDIDFAGAALLVLGIVPLLVALSISRDHDWGSPLMLGLLGWSLLALAVFTVAETRTDHPIVPLWLFRNVTFSVSVVTTFFSTAGMFGAIIFVPLLFQGVLGISATNSGQLLTPMMFGLIGGSLVTGQVMTRVRYYRFIGTFGLALMGTGMYLLSTVRPSTPEIEVVRDIVILGLGLGTNMPLYSNAVQSAVQPRIMGVATSQLQFWRSMGGTIGVAILGSVLAHRLPEKIAAEVGTLSLPPQATAAFTSGASAQQLFDPDQLAAARTQIPAALQPVFDQVLGAVKVGLANTLHDLFLYGVVIVAIAFVASVFLKDVPLRGRVRRPTEDAAPEPVSSLGA